MIGRSGRIKTTEKRIVGSDVVHGADDKYPVIHGQVVVPGASPAGMIEIPVGLHHPLGEPCGAARVHEHGNIIFKYIG